MRSSLDRVYHPPCLDFPDDNMLFFLMAISSKLKLPCSRNIFLRVLPQAPVGWLVKGIQGKAVGWLQLGGAVRDPATSSKLQESI